MLQFIHIIPPLMVAEIKSASVSRSEYFEIIHKQFLQADQPAITRTMIILVFVHVFVKWLKKAKNPQFYMKRNQKQSFMT